MASSAVKGPPVLGRIFSRARFARAILVVALTLVTASALIYALPVSANAAGAPASEQAPGASTTSSAARATTGRVRGAILGNRRSGTPKVRVTWFTRDYGYLGARNLRAGAYSLTLKPGVYRLQFTDRRPSYDVTRYAPTDALVTVRAGATTVKSVRMRKGAAIGGVVRAGGKAGKGARVVAANKDERSWETTADKSGSYALGGLPAGTYSIFTYDKRGKYVGKSTYIKRLKAGKFKRVNVKLTKRAGTLLVDIYTGGQAYTGSGSYLTAVSRANGQFWTARARGGSVTFTGLYPGKYDIQVPGIGNYFAARVGVRGTVRAGRAAFGSVRLTKRGAWVTGTVADGHNTDFRLAGATVKLLSSNGTVLDTATTNAGGAYTLDGQIGSQGGVTVVAGPGPYTAYLEGEKRCQFGTTKSAAFSVVAGRQSTVPQIPLARLPDAQQDPGCQVGSD